MLHLARDTSRYAVLIGKEYVMKPVDQHARYLGSMKEFYRIIASSVRYPMKAIRARTSGTVHILFEVDSLGHADGFTVMNDVGRGCGDAALEGVKLIPNVWIPAMIDGNYYNTRFIIPIKFQIGEDGKRGRKSSKKDEALPVAKSLQEVVISAVGITRTQSEY
jgi:hypothetical protein